MGSIGRTAGQRDHTKQHTGHSRQTDHTMLVCDHQGLIDHMMLDTAYHGQKNYIMLNTVMSSGKDRSCDVTHNSPGTEKPIVFLSFWLRWALTNTSSGMFITLDYVFLQSNHVCVRERERGRWRDREWGGGERQEERVPLCLRRDVCVVGRLGEGVVWFGLLFWFSVCARACARARVCVLKEGEGGVEEEVVLTSGIQY